MTDEQKEIINKMFMRYGSPAQDIEVKASGYIVRPDELNTITRIKYYDENAEKAIKDMEKAIENLKAYRIALCEQYNFIITAPKKKIIKLQREKSFIDNKVFYYLLQIEMNIINEIETTISSTKYSGKERKQAFEAFEELLKINPDAIAIKDIEKKYWEK